MKENINLHIYSIDRLNAHRLNTHCFQFSNLLEGTYYLDWIKQESRAAIPFIYKKRK